MLINRADTVGIAVVSDTEVCTCSCDRFDQVLEIFHDSRIRMMMGKLTIQIAVESRHPTPHLLKGLLGHKPGRSVPAINDDMEMIGLDG